MLAIELAELEEFDFDLALTGFDEKELSSIFDNEKDIADDDFDVDAELQKPTISK